MQIEIERCLSCQRSSDEVPLFMVRHQGKDYWICPQHFPVLIHKPMQLVNTLPGVASLDVSDSH